MSLRIHQMVRGYSGTRYQLAHSRTNEALCHVPEHVLEEYEESDYLHVDAGGPKMTLSRRNTLNFAKSLIGNKEYRRAKFYLEGVQRTTPVEHFLYYFSWYLVRATRRIEHGRQHYV